MPLLPSILERLHPDVQLFVCRRGINPHAFVVLLQQARMPHIQKDQNSQHKHRVKHIKCPFVSQRVPVLAHRELNHTKDTPHHNEYAVAIQRIQALLPKPSSLPVLITVAVGNRTHTVRLVPIMEHTRRDAEEPKGNHLNHQTTHDQLFAKLRVFTPLCHEARAAALDKEGEDITDNKYLCQPGHADQTVLFALYGADDAAQDHVNRRGEEDGWEEEKGVLDDVWHEFVGSGVAEAAGYVADEFHWI